jgi:hypothetical protein
MANPDYIITEISSPSVVGQVTTIRVSLASAWSQAIRIEPAAGGNGSFSPGSYTASDPGTVNYSFAWTPSATGSATITFLSGQPGVVAPPAFVVDGIGTGVPPPPPPDGLNRYMSLADAALMAPTLLGCGSYLAAGSNQQNVALAAATYDLDHAQRYQGRKYDLTQAMQFPRVAFEASGRLPLYGPNGGLVGPVANNMLPGGDVVWDWDYAANAPVVPRQVKMACVYQANSRLDPQRIGVLNRIYGGLTSQKIGSAAETYDVHALLAATGGALVLCPAAVDLMRNYVLRSGRIL